MDDSEDELDSFLRLDLWYWYHFDPLGELVDPDDQVGVAPGRFLQRPYQIQSPDREWSRDGYGLQGLSAQMCLPGVELAALVGANDVSHVGHSRRPVESLAKRVSH